MTETMTTPYSEPAEFLGWASYPIKYVCEDCGDEFDPELDPPCDCKEEEDE